MAARMGELLLNACGALLLLTLEKHVVAAKMQASMRWLLAAPPLKHWAGLQHIALRGGIDAQPREHWRANCPADDWLSMTLQ